MRPYGAAGCVHSCTVRHTNHTSALGPGTRTRAYHLVTATLPRYYLDSLGSIDIWYLASGVYKLGCTRPQAAASWYYVSSSVSIQIIYFHFPRM